MLTPPLPSTTGLTPPYPQGGHSQKGGCCDELPDGLGDGLGDGLPDELEGEGPADVELLPELERLLLEEDDDELISRWDRGHLAFQPNAYPSAN